MHNIFKKFVWSAVFLAFLLILPVNAQSGSVHIVVSPEVKKVVNDTLQVVANVGNVITFTGSSDVNDGIERSWEWNISDASVLNCSGYSSLTMQCTVLKIGSSQVEISMRSVTADGTQYLGSDSVRIYVIDENILLPSPSVSPSPTPVSTVSPTPKPTATPTPTILVLPPAGYEDKVITNPESYKNPFPDTSLTNLEGVSASELYRRGVIGGYPDGEFKGNREVNRAEAAKFLLLARFGTVSEIQNNGKFPDVKDGEWYVSYVVTAANKGIINGYPDGFFRPQNTVNTAEFLKMLSLTFGLEENLSYSYTDVKSTDWFARYVGIAQKYGLFSERSTFLSPSKNLTRKEVAIAIYQYLKNRD